MKSRRLLAAALCVMASFAQAHGDAHGNSKAAAVTPEQTPWGIAGRPRAAARTIEVRMTDAMRFVPDRIQVREGETVRFVVRNEGRMLHELVIGTPQALEEHASLMLKFPGMEHDEPHMAHVAPGKTGRIVWTFNRPGEFRFACLIAGHYQAGMVGTLQVVPAKDSSKPRDPERKTT